VGNSLGGSVISPGGQLCSWVSDGVGQEGIGAMNLDEFLLSVHGEKSGIKMQAPARLASTTSSSSSRLRLTEHKEHPPST